MLNWKIFRCNLTAAPEISLVMKITVIVFFVKLSKLLISLGTSIIHYCVSNNNIKVAIKKESGTKLVYEFIVPPPRGWLGSLGVDLSTFRVQTATAL